MNHVKASCGHWRAAIGYPGSLARLKSELNPCPACARVVTEYFLRALAERFGLTVEKRITTGSPRCHFATFQLVGDRTGDAWPALRDVASSYPGGLKLVGLSLPTNPEYPDRRPYLWAESVWCELEAP